MNDHQNEIAVVSDTSHIRSEIEKYLDQEAVTEEIDCLSSDERMQLATLLETEVDTEQMIHKLVNLISERGSGVISSILSQVDASHSRLYELLTWILEDVIWNEDEALGD